MTKQLDGAELASKINKSFPDAVIEWNHEEIWIAPENLIIISKWLKTTDNLDFGSLRAITAVDYIEYFELIYHLLSMRLNQSAILKTRIFGRKEPVIDSVVEIWKGADLQEREIWDLMGIRFEGHPNLKRVLLWEGFPGHPLRKDFIR